MKNKTILLTAIFMGLITLEKANAVCPATVTYEDYKKLINGESVAGYKFLWALQSFHMGKYEILLERKRQNAAHFCSYRRSGKTLPVLTTETTGY